MTQFPHGGDPYSPPPLPPSAVFGHPPNLPGPLEVPPRYRAPIWLWIVTLSLLGVLVFLQRPEDDNPKIAADHAAGRGDIKPPEASPFVLIGKLTFAMRDLMRQAAAGGGPVPTSPTGEDPIAQLVEMSDSIAGWTGTDRFRPASLSNPPKPNEHPEPAADRLHASILAAEILDKREVEWRLHDIEKDLDPKSPLVGDVNIVRAVYGLARPLPRSSGGGAGGSATAEGVVPSPAADIDPPEEDASAKPTKSVQSHTPTTEELAASHDAVTAISADDADGFRARHGWFAKLVLSRGDSSSQLRTDAASQGVAMIFLLCIFFAGLFVVGTAGVVLLIIGFVKLSSGQLRWRFARPILEREWPLHHETGEGAHDAVMLATPGSVWLETVAVFFAMFLGIKLLATLAAAMGAPKDVLIHATLWGQWLVLLSIFWPMFRGMSFGRWRQEIGWRTNGSLMKEIGAGVVGYIAGLPIYFGMAFIVVIITFIIGALTGSEPHPAGNRLTEVLEGGGIFELILIFTLATMWAPIVEESIFRGCLFRHLRRRTGVVLAGLGSAAVFAVLHGYVIQGLIMVGTLGFWFALMREWRGSIIATATAHALHNGVVITIMLIALAFARA